MSSGFSLRLSPCLSRGTPTANGGEAVWVRFETWLSTFTFELVRKLKLSLLYLVVLLRPLRNNEWSSYAKATAKTGYLWLDARALPVAA